MGVAPIPTGPLPPPALEAFLAHVHDRLPGVTARAMAALPVVLDGVPHSSTYDLLAAGVPMSAGPLRVLDLACGDGHLLDRLARRGPPGLRLHGVDLSTGELAAAAARLGSAVPLVRARAQALPYRDAAFDRVLSHMALMLMPALDHTLAEIRRVLVPGGRLVALVGAASPPSALQAAFVAQLRGFARRLAWADVRFPGAMLRDEAAIRHACRAFDDVVVRTVAADHPCDPAGAWDWFGGTYEVQMLSPSDVPALRDAFLRNAARLKAVGDATVLPLRFHLVEAARAR